MPLVRPVTWGVIMLLLTPSAVWQNHLTPADEFGHNPVSRERERGRLTQPSHSFVAVSPISCRQDQAIYGRYWRLLAIFSHDTGVPIYGRKRDGVVGIT